MTAIQPAPTTIATVQARRARRPGATIVRWATTTDHKVIGYLS